MDSSLTIRLEIFAANSKMFWFPTGAILKTDYISCGVFFSELTHVRFRDQQEINFRSKQNKNKYTSTWNKIKDKISKWKEDKLFLGELQISIHAKWLPEDTRDMIVAKVRITSLGNRLCENFSWTWRIGEGYVFWKESIQENHETEKGHRRVTWLRSRHCKSIC